MQNPNLVVGAVTTDQNPIPGYLWYLLTGGRKQVSKYSIDCER